MLKTKYNVKKLWPKTKISKCKSKRKIQNDLLCDGVVVVSDFSPDWRDWRDWVDWTRVKWDETIPLDRAVSSLQGDRTGFPSLQVPQHVRHVHDSGRNILAKTGQNWPKLNRDLNLPSRPPQTFWIGLQFKFTWVWIKTSRGGVKRIHSLAVTDLTISFLHLQIYVCAVEVKKYVSVRVYKLSTVWSLLNTDFKWLCISIACRTLCLCSNFTTMLRKFSFFTRLFWHACFSFLHWLLHLPPSLHHRDPSSRILSLFPTSSLFARKKMKTRLAILSVMRDGRPW